jgi:hypothetical protein
MKSHQLLIYFNIYKVLTIILKIDVIYTPGTIFFPILSMILNAYNDIIIDSELLNYKNEQSIFI